jgi:uncharacterized RDD family membrane protein YckC
VNPSLNTLSALVVVLIIAAIFLLVRHKEKVRDEELAKIRKSYKLTVEPAIARPSAYTAPADSDDALYEIAMSEADGPQRVPSLWAKAFVDSDGDPNRAKARYIKLRVAELSSGPAEAVQRIANRQLGSDRGASVLAWPRLWARQIDFAICWAIAYGLAIPIGAALALTGATKSLATASIFLWLAFVIVFALLLISLVLIGYETLFLAAFGTTPGKAALGLRVEMLSGGRISFECALRRSLRVWWHGSAAYLAFPVVTAFAWWRSRRQLRGTGTTPWDASSLTRVAGGPVPLWRATLAGMIAITGSTLVFGFVASERREVSQIAQQSIDRKYRLSDAPAANQSKPTQQECSGLFGDLIPGCPQHGPRPPQAIRANAL